MLSIQLIYVVHSGISINSGLKCTLLFLICVYVHVRLLENTSDQESSILVLKRILRYGVGKFGLTSLVSRYRN
jgi:hypothetical protein